MTIWMGIGLFGGLALFLHGMLLMNDNITAAAGHQLKNLLLKLTNSKVKGYLTGVGITLLNQSSSATTVLEAAFVGAGLMTFQQSLAVTLGSELGSTITAQLVAFKITKLALVFVAGGFFASLIWKTKKARAICGSVMGFGLLFLGMDIMSKALEPLRSYGPFLDMMKTIEQPVLGILFGMVFTMIVQSSGATSGITVAMAMNGSMTLAQAIPINLGASLGTCITAVIGSMALNRDAKRTAYIHILFQLAGVAMVFIFLQIPWKTGNLWVTFTRWFTLKFAGTDDPARQIAMAHTLMPLINHFFIFPTLVLWVKLLDAFYPPRDIEKPFGPEHINDALLDQPEIALEQARKEIIRVGGIVRGMVSDCITVFEKMDQKLAEQISLTDIKADILRNAIVPYLTRLAQRNLDEEESKHEVSYLYLVNDLEAIGDIVDKNIMPMARKMISQKLSFSSDGFAEIRKFHDCILENLDLAIRIIDSGDLVEAQAIADTKPVIGKWESDLRMKHIDRLHKGLDDQASSSVHFDLTDQYKRINSHIVSIAYIMMGKL